MFQENFTFRTEDTQWWVLPMWGFSPRAEYTDQWLPLPRSYWFPPIAPSLISPTTLGLFSSDPNNHWDKPQGRRSCSLSLHFQRHSRISIVITIILLLPPFCNSNPPYSSNLAIASCPSPHLLPNNPSQKYPPHLFKQLLMFLQLLLLLLGNSGKFLVLLLDSIETPCSFFLMSQCVRFSLSFLSNLCSNH